MAGLKDIKLRIKSVKNTKKITYAMKLVSAAKLRKAQDAVAQGRVYTDNLSGLLGDLLQGDLLEDFSDPLLTPKDSVKKVTVLVVGATKGLCGAYVSGVNKALASLFKDMKGEEIELTLKVLGKKPLEFCKREGAHVADGYDDLPEDPDLWPLDEICASLREEFINGEADEVHLLYTKFKSALSMKPVREKLLPMDADELAVTDQPSEGEEGFVSGVHLFEPTPAKVLSALLPRIFRARVRQACLDAKAGEHASRMTAMDAATKNAGELIDRLQLKHNKLRQTNITSQILDIVGGAEALKG